jgi:transcriptional regulator with XRE-family HTH domain
MRGMGDIIKPLRRALRRHGPIEVHTRIALERTLAGLTASHCARAMGCSHTLWQQIESGDRAVDAGEAKRIARILGVTVHRLHGEQGLAVPGWKKQGRPRRVDRVDRSDTTDRVEAAA